MPVLAHQRSVGHSSGQLAHMAGAHASLKIRHASSRYTHANANTDPGSGLQKPALVAETEGLTEATCTAVALTGLELWP